MINIQKMMQQAQQVQFKLAEMQEKFKDIDVSGESGGGMVKVTMNCAGELRGLDVDPSLITPDDKETLEDLIVAAINNAMKAKEDKVQEETKSMMRSMGLPEDAKMPF